MGQPPAAQLDWGYFLDVDGTLIEFANTPDAVHVDEALLGLVSRLPPSPRSVFFVRVTSNSMTDFGIRDGDLLVVDKSSHPADKSVVIDQLAENGPLSILMPRPIRRNFRDIERIMQIARLRPTARIFCLLTAALAACARFKPVPSPIPALKTQAD